jgi:hypothetical protein
MPDILLIAQDPAAELQRQVTAFLANARIKARGGLTRVELVTLRDELVVLSVHGLEGLVLAGPNKRDWVLSVVGMLVDSVGAAILPAPIAFLWPIVGPFVRARFVSAASSAIETALTALRFPTATAPSPAPEPAA